MALSYLQLMRFDLLKEVDSAIHDKGVLDKYLKFSTLCHEINKADQFIKELPAFPFSTKNIIRNELVSAIGSTLAIEGITPGRDEIIDAVEEPPLDEKLEKRKQEIVNSVKVYDYIIEEVDACAGQFVYTVDHICKIHELFTDNIEYFGNYPGRFRDTAATFGEPRKKSLCGNYTDIYQAIKYFVEWLNEDEDGLWADQVIAKAIMAHYYLTEIHPFGDGNGRMSRAVEAMILYANKINNYCFWSLANFWSTNRNEYIARLGGVRQTCDPCDFITWGAQGYLEEVIRIKGIVLKKVKQLMFRDYVNYLYATNKDRSTDKRITGRIVEILLLLTFSGKTNLDKFRSDPAYKAHYLNKSRPTPIRDLDRMKSLGLIRITSTDDKQFIEPNYEILNKLNYGV